MVTGVLIWARFSCFWLDWLVCCRQQVASVSGMASLILVAAGWSDGDDGVCVSRHPAG